MCHGDHEEHGDHFSHGGVEAPRRMRAPAMMMVTRVALKVRHWVIGHGQPPVDRA